MVGFSGDKKALKSAEQHMQKMEFASIAINLPPRKHKRLTTKACRDVPPNQIFEVGAASTTPKLNIVALATNRPIALFGLLPRPLVLFSAGAMSGAIAKTITAPLDRVKILLQVKGGFEMFKQAFADEKGDLSVQKRLMAGAAAGMTATLLTHPLDTLRLRLAVDPNCHNLAAASLGASMFGIAPYMALELSCYDLLPKEMPSFARGFSSALIATVSCYPLDTIRRRIQLVSATALPAREAIRSILLNDGIKGMYRGFLPNAIKNLPNKGVKLTVFDKAKKAYAAGQEALDEERCAVGLPALAKA
ncbi:putative envelope ADP,ATP carrier protein, chloroplastic [Nannochloris sp. 'desiccata']|nr:putative envelope ADP,ATP carrier protein, chloroplastic [Chlorella desiccata (nom. nud.)]